MLIFCYNMTMNLSEMNVLIIDDIETVRKALTKSLKELGIEKIQESDSLLSSWNAIMDSFESEAPIDIVFCDWNMPKGDGIELLKKLRSSEDERLKLLKFVMVTGAENKVLEAMDSGAHNVIHKPFTSDIIKLKLELIFNKSL